MPPPFGLIPGSPGTTSGQFFNPVPDANTGAENIIGAPPNTVVPVPNTGSSSNVTGFIPDILMLCQEAAERARVDFTGAYALRSAKRSLDILAMQWANRGLNLWTLEQRSLPLVYNTPTYLMPSDTIDLLYPTIRTVLGGVQQDVVIAMQDFEIYAAIPNKLQLGRPTNIYVQRAKNAPNLYVWQNPDNLMTYTLIYWALRRMHNTGYATNLMDIGFRQIPAMVAGLAWQLALKAPEKDFNLIQMLKLYYNEEFELMANEDHNRSSIRIQPQTYRW